MQSRILYTAGSIDSYMVLDSICRVASAYFPHNKWREFSESFRNANANIRDDVHVIKVMQELLKSFGFRRYERGVRLAEHAYRELVEHIVATRKVVRKEKPNKFYMQGIRDDSHRLEVVPANEATVYLDDGDEVMEWRYNPMNKPQPNIPDTFDIRSYMEGDRLKRWVNIIDGSLKPGDRPLLVAERKHFQPKFVGQGLVEFLAAKKIGIKNPPNVDTKNIKRVSALSQSSIDDQTRRNLIEAFIE